MNNIKVVHSSKRSTSCQITAKIIDFGTAVFTAEEKYSDTLSWLLSWKNSVPGTDGFNVDNCQFKKYFYANKHSLTEEDVAFLRYMDMYSLSKVITACVDTIDQNKLSLTSDGVTANVVSELNLVASNMSSFKTKMKFEECVSTHRNVLRSIIIDTNRSIIRDNRFHLYTLSDETIINVRCPLNEICVALPLVNCAENSDNGHQKCSAI